MNFLIFSEGPLYKFYRWIGLSKDPLHFHKQRAIFICLFAWLPLLILTLISSVKLSAFIIDIDVHVRLLLSLALLLYAEVIMNERLQTIVRQFVKFNIISKNELQQYEKIVASAVRLSGSITVEVLLLLFVITVGRWISNQLLPYDFSNWYAIKHGTQTSLTLPGYWYAFVSLPIFQFILLRWYYRILIWYRFLWQVSRLNLKLNSLHPDKAGGIGFLANSTHGFGLFLAAQSFLLSGVILNLIINTGANLWQFKYEIITWMILLVLIPLIPMTFFAIKLARTKIDGTNEYAAFANHYVNEFRKKWVHPDVESNEALLGTPDIQSLSDLSNSFNVSAQMQVFPFGKSVIMFILVMAGLPFIPLIFTVIPLEKMISQIIGMIF
jgi:hypothetical protein